MRRVTASRTDIRLTQWTRRLTASKADSVPAEDLYVGEHWTTARALPSLAAGFARPTLWVASAGWGLIPATAPVFPYSATFSPGHPDSVPGGNSGAQDWWTTIASWTGPTSGTPRSLTALIAEHPHDRILVILSHAYLTACRADLAQALTTASNNALISILAAGVVPDHEFMAWQLPGDARLQGHVGGTRGALNVRIAAHLLRTGLTDHEAMSRHLRQMLAAAPSLPVYARRRLSDDEVLSFIRDRRRSGTCVSRTGLLRELRDAGMACEQSRFADLFSTATGEGP